MIEWLRDYVRCVATAYPFSPPSAAKKQSKVDPGVCGGELQENGLSLICADCGSEYEIDEGVPLLLGADAPASKYGKEEVWQYYEMHFGPFLREESGKRLSFPQPSLQERASRVFTDGQTSGIDQMTLDVFRKQAPTETFYEKILELFQGHFLPASLALDLGCGLGRMSAELSRIGIERVIGMDLSAMMVKEANRLFVQEKGCAVSDIRLPLVMGRSVPARLELNLPCKDVAFIAGDAERIPLEDGRIDFVLCLNLVDRVRHPRLVISEIARILRPGGRLLISYPYDLNASTTPPANRTADVDTLFSNQIWHRREEIDGVPFWVRPNSRRMVLYMNHCLVYERKRGD